MPEQTTEIRTAADLTAAIKANIDTVAPVLASLMANLGGKSEWSMEDNFFTTERIAELAGQVTGYGAGDQSDDDLRFWHPIATELGFDPDEIEEDDEEDDEEDETYIGDDYHLERGDNVRVVANTSGHTFAIGATATLVKYDEDGDTLFTDGHTESFLKRADYSLA